MRINHNIAALNTYNKLTANTAATSKSLEKLSSGLKINKAGDNAAGLAISEKMRGQIRGLDQASSNASDGISLINTAEGALSETHSILQRMRELAVQSSNDTNTATDRTEIQKEISQLTSEIDRIGNQTEFNTKKLLDGSQNQSVALLATNTAVVSAKTVTDTELGAYSLVVASKAMVAASVNSGTTGIDAAELSTFGTDYDVNQSYSILVEDGSDATHKNVSLLAGDGTVLEALTDQDITGTITVGGGNQDLTIGANAIVANGTMTFKAGVSATYTLTSPTSVTTTKTAEVTTTGKVNIGAFELTVDKTLTDGTDATALTVTGEALQMQIGANEDQSMRVAIQDMRADALGISDIDVSTFDNATAAITTIQTAIDSVSSERAKLGAYTNRLEHTITNLGTSSENMTTSESRIRDVDMAKEMMEFTKNNILSQAAQSMLAQANQQPQGVLQLLQ